MPTLQVVDRRVLFVELVQDERSPGTAPPVAIFVTLSPDGAIRVEMLRIDRGTLALSEDGATEGGYSPALIADKLVTLAGGHPIYGEDSRQLVLLLTLFEEASMRWSVKWKPIGALYAGRLPDIEIAFLSAMAAVREAAPERSTPGAFIVKRAAIYSIARDIERTIGSIDILDRRADLARTYADKFARRAAESLRPLLSGASAVGDYDQRDLPGGRLVVMEPLGRGT